MRVASLAFTLALGGAGGYAFTVGGGGATHFSRAIFGQNAVTSSASSRRARRGPQPSMYFFGGEMSQTELYTRKLQGVVVPLFDPLGDEIPVPFPYEGAEPLSYNFNRPAYFQLVRDAIEKGLFGHLVSKPEEGESLVGAIGCICDVNRDLSDEASGALAVTAGTRFEVVEVVNSFPVPSAVVKVLPDEPYPRGSAPSDRAKVNKANDLEGDTFRSLLDIIRLSSEMESRGSGGSNNNLCPEQTLDTARARLDTYREKALEMSNLHERHQYLGFVVTELLDLSHEDTIECFVTTDSAWRLEFLSERLTAIKEELAALSALDKLGIEDATGGEAQGGAEPGRLTPGGPAKMLSVGMRIEYWWNESAGWCTGKLTGKTELMGEILTWKMLFDDGEEHELKLNMANKARWRILRAGEGR